MYFSTNIFENFGLINGNYPQRFGHASTEELKQKPESSIVIRLTPKL